MALYVWIWKLMLITINHDDKFQHAMWHFYKCYLGVKVPTTKDVNTMCEGNISNVCTLLYDIWIWVIFNPLIFVNKNLMPCDYMRLCGHSKSTPTNAPSMMTNVWIGNNFPRLYSCPIPYRDEYMCINHSHSST
jgi:hypothetical protein